MTRFMISNEQIAKICHEANKAYCESVGDMTQSHWDECAQWQRDSAVAGVSFTRQNPNTTAEDQHIAWCNHKVADGWVYGAEKNAELKTHPCLVPYGDLPEFQRVKDSLFRAIVKAFDEEAK